MKGVDTETKAAGRTSESQTTTTLERKDLKMGEYVVVLHLEVAYRYELNGSIMLELARSVGSGQAALDVGVCCGNKKSRPLAPPATRKGGTHHEAFTMRKTVFSI